MQLRKVQFTPALQISAYCLLGILFLLAIALRISLFHIQTSDYNAFLSQWYDFIQSHGGFAGRLRLVIEAAVALYACWALMSLGRPPFATSLTFPFFKELVFNLGWLFLVFGAFIIVGAGNAVNLTDGLDGLATVPVIIAALSFGFIAYLAGNSVFADYLNIHYVSGTGELAVLCGAVIGGLFVLEAVSVIVQVVSFKLTGKRVFRMAPIHHHFEQLGWTEPQIVIRFWIISVVLALAGLSTLKLR